MPGALPAERRARPLALLAAGALLLGASSGELHLEVDSVHLAASARPAPGEEQLGFVAGRALVRSGDAPRFDVMFVVDVSGSTAQSSGADIDGDGQVGGGSLLGRLLGRGGSAAADSVLAAEVAAVRNLLGTFDPRTTRVGLVAFAGSEDAGEKHAWIETGLTRDYAEVRRSLEDVLYNGASGGTNLYAGLREAGRAVLGGRLVAGRKDAQKHVVLLTDGVPTLPARSRAGPEERAIQAARALGKRGVHVHAFAIGQEAVDRPRAAAGVAKASGGTFTAVRDPADLGRLLAEVRFAQIESLRVSNLTTGEAARELLHNADGSFGALVAVAPGENRIEVVARASDGSERRIVVTQRVVSGSLSLRQEADRARLLAASRARGRPDAERRREVEVDVEPQ